MFHVTNGVKKSTVSIRAPANNGRRPRFVLENVQN